MSRVLEQMWVVLSLVRTNWIFHVLLNNFRLPSTLPEKKPKGTENRKKNRDYPDHYIVKIC